MLEDSDKILSLCLPSSSPIPEKPRSAPVTAGGVSLSSHCQRCGGFMVTQPGPREAGCTIAQPGYGCKPTSCWERQSHSLEPSEAPSLQFDRHIAAPATLPKWTFKGWLWSLDGWKARQSPALAPEGKAGSRWERQSGSLFLSPLLLKAAQLNVDRVLLVFSSGGRAREGTSKVRLGSLQHKGGPRKFRSPALIAIGLFPPVSKQHNTKTHWNVITEPVNWKALGVTGAHTP